MNSPPNPSLPQNLQPLEAQESQDTRSPYTFDTHKASPQTPKSLKEGLKEALRARSPKAAAHSCTALEAAGAQARRPRLGVLGAWAL